MKLDGFRNLPNLDRHTANQCNLAFYNLAELQQDAFKTLFNLDTSKDRGFHMLRNYQYLYKALRQVWVNNISDVSWEMFIKQVFTDDIEAAIADLLTRELHEIRSYITFYLPRIQQVISPEVRAKLVLIGVVFQDHKDIVK